MLRPQDSAFRERKSLNGRWLFSLATPPVFDDEMAVPASYNDVLIDGRAHVGVAWYRTTAWIPRGWAKRRIVLHFEAVAHAATVSVDGREVVRHEGGYTPFEADLTGLAEPGAAVEITVAVDNRLSFATIPPGVIEQTPSGPRQRYFHDFFNYAGIHRNVWLSSTPRQHLTAVDVEAGLDQLSYVLDGGPHARVVLRDADGRQVAGHDGVTGTIRVPGAHRWAPGDGYLYDFEAQLLTPGGDVLDVYHRAVGFRTVEVSGSRFLINGEPFRFQGAARHEDIAVIGKGHNDAYALHDFALLDWLGANSFRTSHYPHSEDVLDIADRRGIVVIDETAAVGLHLALGHNTGPAQRLPTFTPETVGPATRAAHERAIRELIERDRNHPSVVMWSIANEPESEAAGADDYFAPLFALARELDPARPVSFANCGTAPHGSCRVSQFADVLMLNRYYGWYAFSGDLAEAERAWTDELGAWAAEGKPILIAEYGADTMPGLHAVTPEPWSEEFQAAYLEMNHRVFDRFPEVVGEHVWVFADFATVSGITRVGANRKGVFTRDRRPKAAAHLLRKRWSAG